MIAEALRYPVADDGRIAVLAGGGVAVALALCLRFAIALAPSVLSLAPLALGAATVVVAGGYLARVLVAGEASSPPPFEAPSIVRTGLATAAVSVAYALPPAVVAGITFGGIVRLEPGETNALALLFGSTGALFLAAPFLYALPAAVATAAREGVLRGLDPRGYGPVMRDSSYLFGWVAGGTLVAAGVSLAGATITGSGLAGLAAAPVAAYAVLAGTRLVAVGYARTGAA